MNDDSDVAVDEGDDDDNDDGDNDHHIIRII